MVDTGWGISRVTGKVVQLIVLRYATPSRDAPCAVM
jgi:hypothetical protein